MKTPELWKPRPFQLDEATTFRVSCFGGGALPGGGSPGPPAGASALPFRWAVPSGALVRTSSSVLSELNVIVWSPRKYQVTDPPTGILIAFGPNSSIWAATCPPEPARTELPAGRGCGTGGLPCRNDVTAGASAASIDPCCFCPSANWALGLMIVLVDGTTVSFPHMNSRWSRHMKR